MDPELPSRTRKVRFAPKAPPRRKAKPNVPKAEKADENQDEDEAVQANLLHRATVNLAGRGSKVEKKSSPVQVAFGHGSGSSSSLRSFGKLREGNGDKINGENREDIVASSPSTTVKDRTSGSFIDVEDSSSRKSKKIYKEPWDYANTNYPTTLPLRRPYSGNPEILDEKEFGVASKDMGYDESAMNAAKELGLLEDNENEQMIFLQLPGCGNRADMMKGNTSNMGSTSEEFQRGGPMGKILIYKSGAVKWKIGDSLYDVSAGSVTNFPQDVVAMNTVDKDCCMLGAISKRGVVTPDIDFVLNNKTNIK